MPSTPPEAMSWFGPPSTSPTSPKSLMGSCSSLPGASANQPNEFVRLWRGFMTARVTIGLVLLLLQGALYGLGQSHDVWLILICSVYFTAGLAVRLFYLPRRLGQSFDPQWALTIGVDVAAFGVLQFVQGSSVNYAPLLVLPVLLAAVLGSLPLALGTAAGVTLLLLSHATWLSLSASVDAASMFAQSALTGTGGFVIAFLAHQLSTRLASEEQKSHRSQLAVRLQLQINELVIESLSDGVLVVDAHGLVHAANPAARALLGADHLQQAVPFELDSEAGWQALLQLNRLSFSQNGIGQLDIAIHHLGQGARHVRAKTRLTTAQGDITESLCVMFLQDQREIEARIRSAKLASMGRMSAAVAHEIRNPLAAIAQANALLDEDITDPKQRQLTQMVQQNAKRLEKIVEDVLNIARAQNSQSKLHAGTITGPESLLLGDAVARICKDWSTQNKCDPLLLMDLIAPHPNPPGQSSRSVQFEAEHLRRVLVNLLDNARRYATGQTACIQVSIRCGAFGELVLGVWSDGVPLEPSAPRRLTVTLGRSNSALPKGRPHTARICCSNWLVTAPSIVQWPELWGRGAISLIRIAPSWVIKSSTAKTPIPSKALMAATDTSTARAASAAGMRAGAQTELQICDRGSNTISITG